MTVAVEYCGGCNTTYDRVESVQIIKKAHGGCTFESYTPDVAYDAVVVVNGCKKSCVCVIGASNIVVNIRSESDVESAIELLKHYC